MNRTTSLKDVAQLLGKIERLHRDSQFQAVVKLANLAIDIDSQDPSAGPNDRAKLYRLRAEARLELNESLAEAVVDAEEAVRLEPNREGYGLLARVHQEMGHPEQARAASEQAKRLASLKDLEGLLRSVDEHLEQGRMKEALMRAKTGASLCRTNKCEELRPAFWRRQVQALVKLGDLTEAVQVGNRAMNEALRVRDETTIRLLEPLLAQARTGFPGGGVPDPGPSPAPSPPLAPDPGTPRAQPGQGAVLATGSRPGQDSLPAPHEGRGTDELKEHRGFASSPSVGSHSGVPTGVIVSIAIVAMCALLAVAIASLFMICQTNRSPDMSVPMCVYNSLKELKDFIELFAVPLQLWTVILTGVVTAVSWLRYRGPG